MGHRAVIAGYVERHEAPALALVGPDALERIGEEHGVSATAVAINWVLRYPAKMQALIGTTTPSRVQDSADATSFEMTREEWYEIYLSAGNKLP